MSYKTLGQSAPAAATPTDLYTCPASKETVSSTLNICNRSATASNVRVSIRPAGAVQADEHYIIYDLPIPGNETFAKTDGLTFATTDVITVYSENATVSFTLSGNENDV